MIAMWAAWLLIADNSNNTVGCTIRHKGKSPAEVCKMVETMRVMQMREYDAEDISSEENV